MSFFFTLTRIRVLCSGRRKFVGLVAFGAVLNEGLVVVGKSTPTSAARRAGALEC
jgi:hypothetical protein